MLATISDIEKIESYGITHIDNSDHYFNAFLLDVQVTLNGTEAQIVPSSIKDNSALFKGHAPQLLSSALVELSVNKYLWHYMIIHDFEVVCRLKWSGDMGMSVALKVPAYDDEQVPFCICFATDSINVINTREGTMQSLIKCYPISAFCITTHQDQFDLHFTSEQMEEPGKVFSYWHRFPFRSDILAIMKRIGQVPSETLEDSIKLIEESKKMNAELKKVTETYAAQTTDNEEHKPATNTVPNENVKANEMKTEIDNLNEQISVLQSTV